MTEGQLDDPNISKKTEHAMQKSETAEQNVIIKRTVEVIGEVEPTALAQIKQKLQTILNNEGIILIFLDFDDTLVYKKGFGELMEQGEYEKAYELPLVATPLAAELIPFIIKEQKNNSNIHVYTLSKREESAKIEETIKNLWPNESFIAGYKNQWNETLENGNTKTISKGEIIKTHVDEAFKAGNKIAGILFIDDIQENLNTLVAQEIKDIAVETYLYLI